MFTHVARSIAATVLTASLAFVVACGASPSAGGQGSAADTADPSAATLEQAFSDGFDPTNPPPALTMKLSDTLYNSDIAAVEKSYGKKDDSVNEYSITSDGVTVFAIVGQADEGYEAVIFDQRGQTVASGTYNSGEPDNGWSWDATTQTTSHL